MNLEHSEWLRWAVNGLIIVVMALVSWGFSTQSRVSVAESRVDDLVNRLDRIESKIDALIERHVTP